MINIYKRNSFWKRPFIKFINKNCNKKRNTKWPPRAILSVTWKKCTGSIILMSTSCHHSSKLFANAKAKQVLGSQWLLKGFLNNFCLKLKKIFVRASFTVDLKLKFKLCFWLVNHLKKSFLQEGFHPHLTWLSPLESKYNKKKTWPFKEEMNDQKNNHH